ncbi:MAG: 8-oxoguanine DNA glycosylase [Methanomicrobiales archaeon]|nr:8-oxoguanine DNA glycosylase [Methanomicrobiales archaeon]
MNRIDLSRRPFSLDHTLSCGQVFRWERQGAWWQGIVGNDLIRVRQEGDILMYESGNEETIRSYFQLDLDLDRILQSIDRDPVIHGAIGHCRGLRIVRQDPWECLASYICATYANIPGIIKKIQLLCESFGEPFDTEYGTCYRFPSAEAIASSDLCDIRDCRLGYRSEYLCETARRITDDPAWAGRIAALSCGEARTELMAFRGVGPKVADCVLLFAFARYEVFPVDVWISRIMHGCYGLPIPSAYQRIAAEGRAIFGDYAGYAQEYLFCDRQRLVPGRS